MQRAADAFGHACGVKVDGPLARRFLRFVSLTAFQAEGGGIALRAMSMKSALRIYLSVSYGMIGILLIGSLRSPPPFRLLRTSPYAGGRIGRSMLSCRDMAPWLSIHSPTTKWGERWWRQPPKGGCISDVRRAVVWFSHGRKPDCEGFIQTGALYNLEAPYNNPRAKGASNLSPLRTFGPAGRQPSSPIGACP